VSAKAPAARGELRGNRVLVADEAQGASLYNKGAFGVPRSGGGVDLSLLEAAFLAEEGRLSVQDGGARRALPELFEIASRLVPEFETRYLVYRDLRKRGYVAAAARDGREFHLHPRGGFPGRTAPTHVVFAIEERGTFETLEVLEACREAARRLRKVLLAVADEEGDLTYYEAGLAELAGKAPGAGVELPAGSEGVLAAGRVGVWDSAAQEALARGAFGNAVGPVRWLSLVEAAWLAGRGLAVRDAVTGRALSAEGLRALAEKSQSDFPLRYRAYDALRKAGLVPKTGFKFGTHFRVYRGDPATDHAPFLVHALTEGASRPWPEVSGPVRLAHGVRKRLVFRVGDDWLELRRARP